MDADQTVVEQFARALTEIFATSVALHYPPFLLLGFCLLFWCFLVDRFFGIIKLIIFVAFGIEIEFFAMSLLGILSDDFEFVFKNFNCKGMQ
jgi:hypothetical protein